MYVLLEEDVLPFAEAVQVEVAGTPVSDLFAAIPRIVADCFRTWAFHAHRGGGEAAGDTARAPTPATPLRAPTPAAAVPVAADTAAASAEPETETALEAGDSGAQPEQPAPLPPGKKYSVRKGGKIRYPDILLAEVPEEEFDLGEVWRERLEPIVESQSTRAWELFRRSIVADKRFERVGDTGLRYRRVGPRPISLLDRLAAQRDEDGRETE